MNLRRFLFIFFACCTLGPPMLAQQPVTFSLTAANQCARIDATGQATVGITVGPTTFSATLQPEVSIGGGPANNTAVTPDGSQTPQSTITSNGGYTATVAAKTLFLLCATSYTSGTATVTLIVSDKVNLEGLGGGGGGGGLVDSVAGDGTIFTNTPQTGNVALALINSVTGTGGVVLATSPTLTTPNLGTPSAITLTHGTGLPLSGLASTTPYSVLISGASVPNWATPTANSQCFMSAASNYATTAPAFGTCPAGFTNPMTTLGDLIVGGAAGAATRLAGSTTPNGVPLTLASTASGGSATQAALIQPGLTPRNVTASTDTVLVTDNAAQGWVYYTYSGAVAESLPTPTSLGLTDPVFQLSIPSTSATTSVTITPAGSLTINGNSTYQFFTGQNATIKLDGSGNWQVQNATSIPSGITGQLYTAQYGKILQPLSAGIAGRAIISGSSDTVLCDSSTTTQDRETTIIAATNGSLTETIPDTTASGCAANFAFEIDDADTNVSGTNYSASTSVIVNNTSTSKFYILNGAATLSAQTTFTLLPGQSARFSSPDNVNYLVKISTESVNVPFGSGFTNQTANNTVYLQNYSTTIEGSNGAFATTYPLISWLFNSPPPNNGVSPFIVGLDDQGGTFAPALQILDTSSGAVTNAGAGLLDVEETAGPNTGEGPVVSFVLTGYCAIDFSNTSVPIGGANEYPFASNNTNCPIVANALASTSNNVLVTTSLIGVNQFGYPIPSVAFAPTVESGSLTVTAAQFAAYKTFYYASGSYTVTLPASTLLPGVAGQNIRVINYGSGTITLAIGSGTTINGGSSSLSIPAASATAPTSANVWFDGNNYEAILTGAGGSSGANTALSNLASVSINTSLLAQTGVDLGSTAAPFRNLYLFGGGTFGTDSFELTGTSTANRTVTFPDNTGTVDELNLAQTFTAAKTFTNSDLLLLGSSSGATTFTSGNSSASNYTATVPANTGTLMETNFAQTVSANQTFNGYLITGEATKTSSYTGNSTADSGSLIVMNCSGACVYTFNGSPSAGYTGGVISIGSTVATVSLNSLNFNGSSSVPVLITGEPIYFTSDGTNYFGNAPLKAGSNVTFTPSANALSIAASGSGGSGGSLDQITGAAAQATGTETAAGHNYTFAGVETSNLTSAFNITDANSTNNNTNVGLMAGVTGSSTGGLGALIYDVSGTGDCMDIYSGGSVSNATYTVGTKEFGFGCNGNLNLISGATINSAGSGGLTISSSSGGIVLTPATSNSVALGIAGTAASPALVGNSSATTGFYSTGTSFIFSSGGTAEVGLTSSGVDVGSHCLGGSTNATASLDTSLCRGGAGAWMVGTSNTTNDSTGMIHAGGNLLQQTGGNQTAVTTTTCCSSWGSISIPSITAAKNWSFHCAIPYTLVGTTTTATFGIEGATNAVTFIGFTTSWNGAAGTYTSASAPSTTTWTSVAGPSAQTAGTYVLYVDGTVEMPTTKALALTFGTSQSGGTSVAIQEGAYCNVL